MSRALLINPLLVLVAGLGGAALVRIAGFEPHLRELALATGICLLSSELGMIPVALNDNLLKTHPSQAALLGSVVHLMVAAFLTAVVLIGFHPAMSFIYWLLVMYWATLAWMCVWFVRIIRHSAVLPQGMQA